ncbi:MAG: putative transposase [Pseudomonadales bacterium]
MEDSLPPVIQHVGRQYLQYINKTYKRSGTLWKGRHKGRHKGSLVDGEIYLLTCYRYIELNPLAAKMVIQPQDYPWSSYRANAGEKSDLLINPHDTYWSIDDCVEQVQYRYRELFKVMISDVNIHKIPDATSKNFPSGDGSFKLTLTLPSTIIQIMQDKTTQVAAMQ